MTSDEPTVEDLRLVAHHGSGPLVRALAVVQLAKRQDRLDDLIDLMGDE